MKKHAMLGILTFVLILSLSMMVVFPVHADAPFRWKGTTDETYDIEGLCSFTIVDQIYGKLGERIFFDKEGVITFIHVSHPDLKETWSANGKTININISGPAQYQLVSETAFLEIHIGTYQFATIPQYGRVWGWAGRLSLLWEEVEPGVWEITEVTRDAGAINLENQEAICAYLSP